MTATAHTKAEVNREDGYEWMVRFRYYKIYSLAIAPSHSALERIAAILRNKDLLCVQQHTTARYGIIAKLLRIGWAHG